MGYNTTYTGTFLVTPALDTPSFTLLTKLGQTRRMARNMRQYDPDETIYGEEGEFYVEDEESKSETIIDHNVPPRNQPGLWCHWIPTEDRTHLEWDGAEKFYYGANWLEYIIDYILKPRGYTLSGDVDWQKDDGESGRVTIASNVVCPQPDNFCFQMAAMYRESGEKLRLQQFRAQVQQQQQQERIAAADVDPSSSSTSTLDASVEASAKKK